MKHTSIRMIIWAVVAVVLTALLVILLVKPSLLPKPNINIPVISGYTYDNAGRYTAGSGSATGITAVDVGWVDGQVEIVPCEGDTVTFEETCATTPSGQEAMHWYNENGTLHIRYAKSGLAVTSNLNKALTLRLPAGVQYAKLEVEGVSADLTVGAFLADEANFDTVSGKITVAGITGQKADFGTVSGTVNATLACAEIDGESTSGDMTFACTTTPREIDVNTVSGATTLHVPEASGFTAEFDTVSGDFNADFPVLMREKQYIVGDGSAKIDVESVSGDFDIKVLRSIPDAVTPPAASPTDSNV